MPTFDLISPQQILKKKKKKKRKKNKNKNKNKKKEEETIACAPIHTNITEYLA